jgi:hypothetical protein
LPKRASVDELTSLSRDWLPQLARNDEEAGRETVQTVVWLVGLASGILTLTVATPSALDSLHPFSRAALITLLGITVVFGVAQRAVYLLAEHKFREHVFVISACLSALVSTAEDPWELREYWDRSEIVRRLNDDFGADYQFLIERDVALDRCREIYSDAYERWVQSANERRHELVMLFAAARGAPSLTPAPSAATSSTEDTIEDIRARGVRVNRWNGAARLLFLAAGASFAASVVILMAAALFRAIP